MSDRIRLLWVIPVFQAVYAKPFGNFLAQALSAHEEGQKYEINVYVPERELLHGAMNKAAQIVVDHGFAAMIVSDDDCFPPYDAVPRLLRRWEAGHPVVAGVGFTRGYPHTTTVGRYFPEGLTLSVDPKTKQTQVSGFHWLDKIEDEPEELVPCDFCGFPIVIIDAEALKKMERPWFGTQLKTGSCTHDVFFGDRCAKAKVPIVVDRTITCGHLADAPKVDFEQRPLIRSFVKSYEALHQPPGSAA